MWMDNLERERQWALDHGLDQGLDRQVGQDRQDGLDQLIQGASLMDIDALEGLETLILPLILPLIS